jgi:hypothetical protein
MINFRRVGMAVLLLALLTRNAAAQLPPEAAPAASRKAPHARLVLPEARSLPALTRVQQGAPDRRRDSVWNGVLIGAGIGAGGGFIWARNICGTTDDECFAIAGPAGILSGIGIGAAIGAVADALHK